MKSDDPDPVSNLPTPEPGPTSIDGSDHELAVVRQQISQSLFPRSETMALRIGRFVVERRLGAGAMGVVYAARDPALDRRVAIKLVRPEVAGDHKAQLRLEREARALAKLSHPNIVAIHEVGEHHGQVFLAMEHVQGQSLRAWQERARRSTAELLAMYVQAGRGLAAAHAAGLVHRDFKPDNVLVDDEGRARVVDFGLVSGDEEGRRAELARWQSIDGRSEGLLVTHTHALVGTPAYMSPEQFGGEAIDVHSDQFAFCVALWESMYGERPFDGQSLLDLSTRVCIGRLRPPTKTRGVPGWVRSACERGLSVDPQQRWPSMDALLDALATGRTRARARSGLAVAGALVALGAGVEGYRRYDRAQRIAACEASGDEITIAWNDERRQALHDALIATGASYAATTADKVMPWLERQAENWREARVAACMDADVSGRWSTETLDRSLWCLDERRSQLESLVDELTYTDVDVVQRAVKAAAGLPSVAWCRDERMLDVLAPPPEDNLEAVRAVRADVVRAENLLRAGRYDSGLTLAREALAHAEALEWSPLVATAGWTMARLLESTGKYPEAEAALEDVYFEAAQRAAPEVAFEAANLLVFVVGHHQARHADGRRWGRHAELALASLHEHQGLEQAHLFFNLAGVDLDAGDYVRAKDGYERALAIQTEVLGPDHPELAGDLNNLASVNYRMGDDDQAKALYERALSIRERALGPDHPDVANSLTNIANIYQRAGAYERARLLLERALSITERVHGPKHPSMAVPLSNLGNVYYESGAYEQAKAAYERALAIRQEALGLQHPMVAIELGNLGNVCSATDDDEQAKAYYARALAILEQSTDSRLPYLLANFGGVNLKTGDYEQARALTERALSIWEPTLGPEHPNVGICVGNLATVHRLTGAYEQAGPLYARALSIAEQALGPDHHTLSQPLVGLAEVALAQHRPADAVPLAQRAVAVQANQQLPAREQAEAGFVLVRALWEAPVGGGRDRPRAVRLAEETRKALQEAGTGGASQLAELEQWLEKRGP